MVSAGRVGLSACSKKTSAELRTVSVSGKRWERHNAVNDCTVGHATEAADSRSAGRSRTLLKEDRCARLLRERELRIIAIPKTFWHAVEFHSLCSGDPMTARLWEGVA